MKTMFSHYPKGYYNKKHDAVLCSKPDAVWSIYDAYRYIISGKAKMATEGVRTLVTARKNADAPTKEENEAEQEFKKLNFETCTFSGVFTYRNARSLAEGNQLVTVDIDHLPDGMSVDCLQALLLEDKWLKPALSFRSPRNKGLKHIVIVPQAWRGLQFRDVFLEVCKYIAFEYGIEVDKSGSDVCRTCYLPHDSKCFINQEFFNTDNNGHGK